MRLSEVIAYADPILIFMLGFLVGMFIGLMIVLTGEDHAGRTTLPASPVQDEAKNKENSK